MINAIGNVIAITITATTTATAAKLTNAAASNIMINPSVVYDINITNVYHIDKYFI